MSRYRPAYLLDLLPIFGISIGHFGGLSENQSKSQYPCQNNSIPGSRPANWICFLCDWRREYEAGVVERDEVAITDPENPVSPAPGSSAAFGGVKKRKLFLTATTSTCRTNCVERPKCCTSWDLVLPTRLTLQSKDWRWSRRPRGSTLKHTPVFSSWTSKS